MRSKRGNAQALTNQVTKLLDMHQIVLTNQHIEQHICNINFLQQVKPIIPLDEFSTHKITLNLPYPILKF